MSKIKCPHCNTEGYAVSLKTIDTKLIDGELYKKDKYMCCECEKVFYIIAQFTVTVLQVSKENYGIYTVI